MVRPDGPDDIALSSADVKNMIDQESIRVAKEAAKVSLIVIIFVEHRESKIASGVPVAAITTAASHAVPLNIFADMSFNATAFFQPRAVLRLQVLNLCHGFRVVDRMDGPLVYSRCRVDCRADFRDLRRGWQHWHCRQRRRGGRSLREVRLILVELRHRHGCPRCPLVALIDDPRCREVLVEIAVKKDNAKRCHDIERADRTVLRYVNDHICNWRWAVLVLLVALSASQRHRAGLLK